MRFHLLEDGLVGLKPVPLLLRVNISNAKIILFQQAVIVADVIYEKLTFRFPLFLSSAFAVQTATFSTKMLSPVTQGRSVTPSCCCTTFSVAATATDSNPLDFDAIKP